MLTLQAASDRATRFAIQTGEGLNLATIQATQVAEGFSPCFGRAESPCGEKMCAYYEACMRLLAFTTDSIPADNTAQDFASWSMPADQLLPKKGQSHEAPVIPGVTAFAKPKTEAFDYAVD